MSREESDRKYYEKYPTIRVRVSQTTLDQIPKPRSPWIADAIETKIRVTTKGDYETPDGDYETLKSDYERRLREYEENQIFMLLFFDKNQNSFEITEKERTRFEEILQVMQNKSR